jgi:hypothetical protein
LRKFAQKDLRAAAAIIGGGRQVTESGPSGPP